MLLSRSAAEFRQGRTGRSGRDGADILRSTRRGGTATIRNLRTGQVTTVRIGDRALLGRLKLGQTVQANGYPAQPVNTIRGY